MAKDVKDTGDVIGAALGTIAREVSHGISGNGHSKVPFRNGSENGFSAARGLAAGAVLATAAPLAGKAVKKLVVKRAGSGAEKGSGLAEKVTEGAKDTVGKGVKDAVSDTAEKAGGAPGLVKEIGKKMLPGGGGESDGESKGKGTPGVGKGRRMPIQQAVDIGVPLSTAYNQWTQFEEWPQFMHRLDQATQEDDCTVSFRTKVWGMSKEFTGQIVEQRPDERIQWSVNEGVIHTGVVTFHELAPNLTRIQVSLDVEPGSLIEKAARGMRHVKRAVRGDLARFKAYIEMQEVETGAWRGVIHDGELVEEHDEKYDKDREYAEFEDIHDREHSHSPQAQEQEQKKQKQSSSSSRRSGSSSSKSRRRGSSSSRSKASSSAHSSSGRSRSTKKRSGSGSSRKRSTSRS
ncbi:MAG TPA: SRPBCC family protein [Solirubrobacterales bacterium]|nr:SRPBCC family protein [Solirubrobacterales bacterium]